ncbi:MAG: SusC/RagA family TonB-linked outer membrane protein [Marinifilaceae bacterium]|jgi:TonB-linked SusC/RagA family outer membrane protein|nr:SusC/RagA family TonB-linked outer membrane protein [Marinifilaceae bacterium]
MRNVIVFVILFGIQANAAIFSQQRIDVKLENSNLENLIHVIESKTNLGFLYDPGVLKNVKLTRLNHTNEKVEVILEAALKNTGLEFLVENKTILIQPKITKAKAQQKKKKVTGTVVDDQSVPLPGVSVVIKGTTVGISTDINGKFTLEYTPKGNDMLVFSFIGMKTQELKIDGKKDLKVILKSDSENLNEVVVKVSTGYQKIDRKLFAGSAAKIKAEDAVMSGVSDIGKMMEGKVAGVSVQNVSGTFGAAPKIRIRGASSIYGDTKPLWVVDGVVLEDVVDISPDELSSGDIATLISSSVAGLNSEDIASIETLKDASATALYGARAMNGVIVINTKKGVKGKPKLNIKSEFTVKTKPNYSQYDIMNSQEQMSVFRELERKGYMNYADLMRSKDGGVYYQMYKDIETYEDGEFKLVNTPEARAEYLKKYERANTDWFDILFRNSLTQNHSVSLSGGSETANFFVSTGFLHDSGWSIADKVKRYTINMKGSFKLNDKLTVGLSTKGSYREQDAPGTFSRKSDPTTGAVSREFDINPFSYALNTSRTVSPYNEDGTYRYNRMNHTPFNILKEFENNYVELDVLDLNIQGDAEYKINKAFTYNVVGNIRFVKSTSEHIVTEDSNAAEVYRSGVEDATIAQENKYLYKDIDNPSLPPVSAMPAGGFLFREDNHLSSFYVRNVLNFNKTFNEIHLFNGMLGQEVRAADRKYTGFDGYGIQYKKGNTVKIYPDMYKKLSQGGFPNFGKHITRERHVAFFTNIAYSYQGKYTLNGTARVDGSNKLGESNSSRWLPTWNLSAKWNASEEEFIKSSNIISNLSFRATYGLTASMGPATNSKAVFRSALKVAPFENEIQNKLYVSSTENSELTWEKQYEMNIGGDIGLWNGKVQFSFDYYRRKGFDLIAAVQTSGIGGEGYKLANYADMDSSGCEFSLGTKNYKTKDFSWNSNLTFSYNTNEITKIQSSPSLQAMTSSTGAAIEGKPVRGLYSVPFAGLNEEGIPTFYDASRNRTTDVNFQSTENNHLVYEGSVDPKMTGGLSNIVKYKNLKLNVFITYNFGNKIRLYPSFSSKFSDLDAMPRDFINRWLMTGDEKLTNVPTIISAAQEKKYGSSLKSTYNAYNYSDVRVAKGDFIRLKDISVTYDVPKKYARIIGFAGAQLKATGSNLMLLYSDKKLNGQDPEFFGSGGVALPNARQYSISLKLNL